MNGVEQALIEGVASGTVILYPALGELIGERAGVINLGTEGCMLTGALAAYATTASTGSALVGVLAGAVAGMLLGLIHAFLVVRRRADQLASGLTIWFFAVGLTAVLGAAFVSRSATPLPTWRVPLLGSIPWVGNIFFDADPLVYLGFLLVPAVWWLLFRTRTGLVLRATGERPEVVRVAGHRPATVQIVAVSVGAALAGIGGAQLSIGYVDNWFDDMTNGYGFVAVAVVLFAAWRPLWVLLGSYLFGLALAAASVLQAHGVSINQYLLDALPYLVTIVAMVIFTRRGSSQAPESIAVAMSDSG